MTKAYSVFLSVAYEPDQTFGTFSDLRAAESYRDELINDANMSHYQDIEVGEIWIWDSVHEMKTENAKMMAEWQRLNPEKE